MGTPKKKPTPATKAAPTLLIPGRDFDVEKVRLLTEQTRVLADDFETVIENLLPEHTVPQRVMRCAVEGPRLVEQAGRFSGLFTAFAQKHRLGEGGFMHEAEDGYPLVVISFPTSGGSITPKWKEEALRLGEELAKVKGEAFNAESFEADIRSRYSPSKISTRIELTEAG